MKSLTAADPDVILDGDATDDDSIADHAETTKAVRQLSFRPLQPKQKPGTGVRLCKLKEPKRKRSKKDKDAELGPD